MHKRSWMNPVNDIPEIQSRCDAVHRLGEHTRDAEITELLCNLAIETDTYQLRAAATRALKHNAAEANRRFALTAITAANPSHRRRAFMSLSLMECRDAKQTVLKGLQDPIRSVRMAAAFNAGLYCDAEVLNALEVFFARNRSLIVLDGLCRAVKHLRAAMQWLTKNCSIRFSQNPKKAKEKHRLYVKLQAEKMSGS